MPTLTGTLLDSAGIAGTGHVLVEQAAPFETTAGTVTTAKHRGRVKEGLIYADEAATIPLDLPLPPVPGQPFRLTYDLGSGPVSRAYSWPLDATADASYTIAQLLPGTDWPADATVGAVYVVDEAELLPPAGVPVGSLVLFTLDLGDFLAWDITALREEDGVARLELIGNIRGRDGRRGLPGPSGDLGDHVELGTRSGLIDLTVGSLGDTYSVILNENASIDLSKMPTIPIGKTGSATLVVTNGAAYELRFTGGIDTPSKATDLIERGAGKVTNLAVVWDDSRWWVGVMGRDLDTPVYPA